MHVHFESRVALVMPRIVASRRQAEAAETHGFMAVGGHHDGPNDLSRVRTYADERWVNSNPGEFSYVTTTRNPFDVLLTLFIGRQDAVGQDPEMVTVDFLERESFERPLMYPFVRTLPGPPLIMRYENGVREEFDRMLKRFGLASLKPEEFPPAGDHATPNKPRDWWNHFTPKARTWVEENMGEELAELGYGWGTRT